MFDRIAPVYDADEPRHDRGARPPLAPAHGRRGVVRPGRPRARRLLRHRRPRGRGRARRRGRVTGLDFSERMLERARRKSPAIEWVQGDVLALPFADASFDAATVGFGVRNVERPRGGPARAAPRASAGRPARRSSRSRRRAALLAPFYRLWFDRVCRCSGACCPAAPPTRTCPRASAASRSPRTLAAAARAGRASREVGSASLPGVSSPCTWGRRGDRRRRRRSNGDPRGRPGLDGLPRRARGAPRADGREPPRARRRGRERGARGRRQAPAPAARLPLDAGRRRSRRSRPGSPSSSCTWRRSSTTT